MTTADLHNIIYILADKASDAINPILVALIAEEPLLMRERLRQKGEITKSIWPETLRFWGRAILCVGVAVVMAEAGKKIQVWPGHNNFPSGHTTFAASAAACLVLRRGNSWLWLAGPLAVLMAASLVYGHWHTTDEVIAGLFLGPSVAWSVWQITHVRRAR